MLGSGGDSASRVVRSCNSTRLPCLLECCGLRETSYLNRDATPVTVTIPRIINSGAKLLARRQCEAQLLPYP